MENRSMTKAEIQADIELYQKLNKDERFNIEAESLFLCVGDKYHENGNGDWTYFVQDIWGARKVFHNAPKKHYDVGSSVAGFLAHLLSFRKDIILIDIRPMDSNIEGVEYICADATNMINIKDNSIESLSALCSIEHFGLGRYGDPIDPEGWRKALKSFSRVIIPGGKLYLSVPIGVKDRVCFNAHREFNPETIIQELSNMNMKLLEMSGVVGHNAKIVIYRDDNDNPIIDKEALDQLGDHNCGFFEFVKV